MFFFFNKNFLHFNHCTLSLAEWKKSEKILKKKIFFCCTGIHGLYICFISYMLFVICMYFICLHFTIKEGKNCTLKGFWLNAQLWFSCVASVSLDMLFLYFSFPYLYILCFRSYSFSRSLSLYCLLLKNNNHCRRIC